MILEQILQIGNKKWVKHSSDTYTIIKEGTNVEYASAIDIFPTNFTYRETSNRKPVHIKPSLLECERILEIRD